jgi:hypothetical protein
MYYSTIVILPLQDASQAFADNAAQLRKDQQKQQSWWPF